MAALTIKTFADIVAAVREEVKENASDTTAINRIKRDINIVYSEVIAAKRWWWLVESDTLQIPAAYKVGTAQVVHGSNRVELSVALPVPKEGFFFTVDGQNESYFIESHTPGSAVLKLSQSYAGATNMAVGFKIWKDHIPLPSYAKETVEVLSPLTRAPLENLGLQEFRRLSSALPKLEGVPEAYYTGDFTEPFPDEAIANMPEVLHKSSLGVIKTVVFKASLPAAVIAGKTIRVKAANHASYNGDVRIAKIQTTNVSNDTIVYVGKDEHTEPFGADHDIEFRSIITTADRTRYRAIYFYPSITDQPLNLMLDYQKNVMPLENDTDEPIIPLDDRMVLVYGALQRSWSRARNPEEAARNLGLYRDTMARMAGYMQDSVDKPLLKPSRFYLGAKRNSFKSRRFNLPLDGFFGASGASTGGSIVATLGTPDTVAIFNSNGELEGSSVVSVAELNYLDGASSNLQNQIDTINGTLASAFVTNALVSPSAAIARSKLAAGTADRVVITDGSGVMSESSVTPTELSFLSGVTPLTSVTLVDNTVVATPAISIPVASSFCFIVYSIKRSASYEGGMMVLMNNTVTADLAIDSSGIGSTGITLTADVSGGNVRLLYTSTNTGFNGTLKYAVIKWAA